VVLVLVPENDGLNRGPVAGCRSSVVNGCGACHFANGDNLSKSTLVGRSMLGAGGGWGSDGGLSNSLLIILPEYQQAPPVWGRVTLFFHQ
jgi:hypothetical protein